MQSDYTPLRDIIRVCRDAYPNWVEPTDQCDRLPGRAAPDSTAKRKRTPLASQCATPACWVRTSTARATRTCGRCQSR